MKRRPPSLVVHSIAYVRTESGEEGSERRGTVFCRRRGESVTVETCGHCPRFAKVIAAPDGGDQVHCAPGEPECGFEEERAPLQLPRVSVASLMTRNIVCVRPDLSLDALSALFVETGLKAVPVLDAQARLIGFVSEAEMTLTIQSRRAGPDGLRTVGDVMMPYALALPETASVTRAAAVMAFEGQQRLAIVSSEGQIVGVLSASDVMYWLAKADGHVLPRPRAR